MTSPSAGWTRRRFVQALAALAAGCSVAREREDGPFVRTRGVVLVPDDLTLADWPQRAAAAGLTTIGLHHGSRPSLVAEFVRSERGRRFLDDCRRLGLAVEYELHAMAELNDESGAPNGAGGGNPCVHSRAALDRIAERALALDEQLRPTTHRRFFWGNDGAPWCRCEECVPFSDSDQALLLENHLVAALRRVDPQAQLAHLAYASTIAAPTQVKPAAGVFLEFAPFDARARRPFTSLVESANGEMLAALDANLAVFPRETAQALDYWLDVSMQSSWRKPAKELRFADEPFAADVDLYARRGIRHVTSFAVFVDADYVGRFGFPDAVRRYGALLSARR
jgi:hypothetical protein